MKTPMLALLIPLAICAACSKKEETVATSTPPPAEATPNAPANGNAPATGNASANGNATNTAPVTAATPKTGPAAVKVTLISAAGSSVKGELTVSNEGDAVHITGDITGLMPGKEHGFHVHEFGKCELPDFKSAGEHFNPTKAQHGEHLGDLPNAKADENGHATINAIVKGPNLVDKDGAPTAIIGKALIVHAMPDDYKTQPSGGSGARIACGVIRRAGG
jgi:Cu-Zn family superoxide dismutase